MLEEVIENRESKPEPSVHHHYHHTVPYANGHSARYVSSAANGHVPGDPDTSAIHDTVLLNLGDPEPPPPKFPKERRKLCLAAFLFFCAGLSNNLVLAWIHERVPATAPLPDLFFMLTPPLPWALAVSEYLIFASGITMIIVCFLHRHRWILFRRVFFMLAILYFGRSFTMLVTQVPVADPTYYCSPKLNQTGIIIVLQRAGNLLLGVGLSMNGRHNLCGDYIYSGHTLILMMTYLVVKEYSPRRYWHLHWLV